MHADYRSAILKQLRDQQVRFAPREKKAEQVDNAETLLSEVASEKNYPYEFICFRLTGFRPAATPFLTVSGDDLQHDLALFIEDVSDAADVKVEDAGQPVYTVEELSKMFNVSTKTISRWRQQGLVSRRFLFDGRKRVGFLQRSVDRFVSENSEKVRRGERFSQMTDQERGEILQQARRLARTGTSPSEVSRRIASEMHRSIETIRYTLKHFDEQHPDLAIFPDRSGPLKLEAKQMIYAQYRRGTPVEDLARRYGRTRTAIYRVINEIHAEQIMALPLEHLHHPSFDDPRAAAEIVAATPEGDKRSRPAKAPAGLPPYLASLYDVPLLTREQEMHLFRKMNYLKYQASQLRDQLDPAQAKSSLMDEIERLNDEAVAVKNQIVQANLRLVVSIAKRHVNQADELFGLISDGNMSLIRAVEKFDFSRGNKFSTYASWAIMKNFARTIPHEFRYRDRFRTSSEEMFMAAEDARGDHFEQEAAQQLRELEIGKILARLDEREQQIIISRYGLDHRVEPKTLKEVGVAMGVTKERIRQIEARALSKLRQVMQEEHIDILLD